MLFICSEALLIHLGLVKIYFIVFIPVFVSSSALSLVPLLLFLIPVLLFFFGGRQNTGFEEAREPTSTERSPHAKGGIKYGGFLMIGPIPILFGRGISSRILMIMAILMVILIVSWFIFAK
jgi:uncharacterized protein (TIGR00304 family)